VNTTAIASLDEAIGCVEAAFETLAASVGDGSSLVSSTDAEVIDALRRLEVLRRKAEPVDQALIAEVDRRAVAFTNGCRNTAAFVRHLLTIAPGEAAGRVSAARTLGPRRGLTGELLEPLFPAVAAAQTAGEISARHAAVIVQTVEKLPDEVAAVADRTVEARLVEVAREHDPVLLARHAGDLADALDQDKPYRDLAYRERTRAVNGRRHADGSMTLTAELTPEAGEHVAVLFDALAKPAPAADGTPDPRTPAQRRHDALLAALKLVQRAELLPKAAGVTATIVLTMDAETYATGSGVATTGHGYRVPADVAKTWAGAEARIIGVLLDKAKAIAAYSSTQRIFTEQQRLAISARDGGCTFPGCDAPPGWCEVHHVIEYCRGGPTSVDNAAMVCGYNHQHYVEMGWECRMIDGHPWWIPPAWIDATRTPRRNTMHDHDVV
jgi:hypothetical protein